MRLVALDTIDPDAIERLLDAAFGADRHGRTAYRLRAGTRALPDASFAALDGRTLVGTIQCWPVALDGDDGRRTALTMIGPVAVEPARQQSGIGRLLMTAALDRLGDAPAMLIGDPEYYARFFSFSAAATGAWRLPGPVERHRLLARGIGVPTGGGDLVPSVALAA